MDERDERDEKDHSHLVNAPVKIRMRGFPVLHCKVVDIEFNLGLTIATTDTSKPVNVLCMIKPDMHKKLGMGEWHREVDDDDQQIYAAAFKHTVKGIEQGFLDDEWFSELHRISVRIDGDQVDTARDGNEMHNSCIFSQ